MCKEEYIQELRRKLSSLPKDEIEEAILYVSEYFDEAGEGNEEAVIHDLGTPAKFASQIIADYEIKTAQLMKYHATGKTSQENKKPWNSVFKVLLGILSLPLSIPLAIAVLIGMVLLAIVLFIPFIILVVLMITLVSSISFFFYALFVHSITSIAQGAFMLSSIFILGAFVCLIIAGLIALGNKFFPWLTLTLGKWYHKLKGEENHE